MDSSEVEFENNYSSFHVTRTPFMEVLFIYNRLYTQPGPSLYLGLLLGKLLHAIGKGRYDFEL